MISAKVIADSKNEFGNRITTMVVTFPRIILAEFNTHRMFSRNSASSRAIPFEKMLKSVQENPFIPIAWQKDHKGMQGTEYITDEKKLEEIRGMWLNARDQAVSNASYLSTSDLDVTKQLCNRLLEPFMWHTVVVTACEFENFFYLRCPKYMISVGEQKHYFRSKKEWVEFANKQSGNKQYQVSDWDTLGWLRMNEGQAEIHAMALAEAMYDAYQESTPKALKAGEWHIPFGDNISYNQVYDIVSDHDNKRFFVEPVEEMNQVKIKIATARCARVSYTVVGEEGKVDNYENDIKLHDRLAASGHWSPFEHCAQAMNEVQYTHNLRGAVAFKMDEGKVLREFASEGWSGNFRGFIQYRKTFENENITK